VDSLRTITRCPIGVGFGIRDAKTRSGRKLNAADGVIVGSVNLVNAIAENKDASKRIYSLTALRSILGNAE